MISQAERNKRMTEDYKQGRTLKELAKKYKLKQCSIQYILIEAGVMKRRTKATEQPKRVSISLYVGQEITLKEKTENEENTRNKEKVRKAKVLEIHKNLVTVEINGFIESLRHWDLIQQLVG